MKSLLCNILKILRQSGTLKEYARAYKEHCLCPPPSWSSIVLPHVWNISMVSQVLHHPANQLLLMLQPNCHLQGDQKRHWKGQIYCTAHRRINNRTKSTAVSHERLMNAAKMGRTNLTVKLIDGFRRSRLPWAPDHWWPLWQDWLALPLKIQTEFEVKQRGPLMPPHGWGQFPTQRLSCWARITEVWANKCTFSPSD